MTGHVKVGGAWKSVGAVSTKVGGSWKTVSAAYTKIGGTWKQWYSTVISGEWLRRTAPATMYYNGGAYFDSKVFVFGANASNATTNEYYYTADAGDTWTMGTFPTSRVYGAAATNGSRLVVIPGNSNYNTGYYSDNGITWTLSSAMASGSPQMRRIIWSSEASKFLIVSESATGGFSYSSDGAAWTEYDMGNGARDIAYNPADGIFYAPQAASTASMSVRPLASITTSGLWSTVTLPSSGSWVSVACGNGLIVTIKTGTTGNNLLAYSSNGTTWTAATSPVPLASDITFFKLYFHNGYFYLQRGGDDLSRPFSVWRSANATTWTEVFSDGVAGPAGQLNYPTAWVSDGNYIYIFGNNRTAGSNEYVRGPIA